MKSISTIERKHQLLQFVREQQRVSLDEICAQLSISQATARRDLQDLAGEGLLVRVYGGAVALHEAPPEPPVLQRRHEQSNDKHLIASAAIELIHDGETIFIGSGSTTYELALLLNKHRQCTVITNSLLVLDALRDDPAINLVGLGGQLRHDELSLVGHLVESHLQEIHVDKVIMGIRALDLASGLTNHSIEETMTDRACLRIGREVILLADHTKCQRVSLYTVAPLSVINTFITDKITPTEFCQELEQLSIRVIRV